ncbi:MAG: periplasmic heavy metal sensor [Candidatus Omnitrophota bacterium]
MKKSIIAAIFVFMALALSSPDIYAYHPGDDGPDGKDFMDKKGPPREDIFKDLNLTAEQKRMLDENKNKHKEEMKSAFDAMRSKEDLLRNELQKQNMDVNKVTQINNELKQMHADMQDRRLAGILEVRRILSPDQFKKFTEKMEKRAEQRHKK